MWSPAESHVRYGDLSEVRHPAHGVGKPILENLQRRRAQSASPPTAERVAAYRAVGIHSGAGRPPVSPGSPARDGHPGPGGDSPGLHRRGHGRRPGLAPAPRSAWTTPLPLHPTSTASRWSCSPPLRAGSLTYVEVAFRYSPPGARTGRRRLVRHRTAAVGPDAAAMGDVMATASRLGRHWQCSASQVLCRCR